MRWVAIGLIWWGGIINQGRMSDISIVQPYLFAKVFLIVGQSIMQTKFYVHLKVPLKFLVGWDGCPKLIISVSLHSVELINYISEQKISNIKSLVFSQSLK